MINKEKVRNVQKPNYSKMQQNSLLERRLASYAILVNFIFNYKYLKYAVKHK